MRLVPMMTMEDLEEQVIDGCAVPDVESRKTRLALGLAETVSSSDSRIDENSWLSKPELLVDVEPEDETRVPDCAESSSKSETVADCRTLLSSFAPENVKWH